MHVIQLDFCVEDATTDEEIAGEVSAWQAEFAPGVAAEVVDFHGPGGGNPIVRLTSDDLDALTNAVRAYDGDGDSVEELLASITTA